MEFDGERKQTPLLFDDGARCKMIFNRIEYAGRFIGPNKVLDAFNIVAPTEATATPAIIPILATVDAVRMQMLNALHGLYASSPATPHAYCCCSSWGSLRAASQLHALMQELQQEGELAVAEGCHSSSKTAAAVAAFC